MKGVRGYRSTMGMYLQVHRCSQTVYVSPEVVVVGMGGPTRDKAEVGPHAHAHAYGDSHSAARVHLSIPI